MLLIRSQYAPAGTATPIPDGIQDRRIDRTVVGKPIFDEFIRTCSAIQTRPTRPQPVEQIQAPKHDCAPIWFEEFLLERRGSDSKVPLKILVPTSAFSVAGENHAIQVEH